MAGSRPPAPPVGGAFERFAAASRPALEALTLYARNLGLAFQITDDLLDLDDLPGRPATPLFRPGSLETTRVTTYGERVAPAAVPRRETDREYLEKLKSLGYLN